jgi:hypothetical protein
MKKADQENIANPFKVPDNYFEEVNRRIIAATSGSVKEPVKISVFNRFRTSILVAASITGFLIISYSAIRLLSNEKEKAPVSEILNEISTESFMNEIDISELEETLGQPVNSELRPDVTSKEIVDYLLFENIEISEIYAKL